MSPNKSDKERNLPERGAFSRADSDELSAQSIMDARPMVVAAGVRSLLSPRLIPRLLCWPGGIKNKNINFAKYTAELVNTKQTREFRG